MKEKITKLTNSSNIMMIMHERKKNHDNFIYFFLGNGERNAMRNESYKGNIATRTSYLETLFCFKMALKMK